MSTWDISRIRALAGMQPLTESYDDDDDGMSASERALLKKAEGDLKKKGVKVKDADPDKDLHALAQRRKAKEKAKEDAEDREEAESKAAAAAEKKAEEKEAPKAEEKKEEPRAEEKKESAPKKEEPKAEEKKEEPATEAKRRGKAPNPESFNQHAKSNAKNMTRGEFLKWAAEKHGKGKAYASALFAKYNPKSGRAIKTDECYVLQHPSVSSFLLAENKMMNQYQWIDSASPMDPLVFESEAEAKKVAEWIYEWKNQTAQIIKIDLKDE